LRPQLTHLGLNSDDKNTLGREHPVQPVDGHLKQRLLVKKA
jgi:hypothetical protein